MQETGKNSKNNRELPVNGLPINRLREKREFALRQRAVICKV
jgi:hypothetical protein